MYLRKELAKETNQELLLEFKHIGVKPALCVSVTVDIKKEFSLLAWIKAVGLLDKLEESVGCVVEVLVTVNHVVNRDSVTASFNS